MNKQSETKNSEMKILLHTCCAPCIIYPLEVLQGEEFMVVSYFYNPNIQPYQEYEQRRNCLEGYCEDNKIEIIEGNYDIDRFFQDVVFREKVRCRVCYRLRLSLAAKVAKKGHFEAFTTTLLGSPYQNHELVRELGKELENKYGVPFMYRDFREGWKRGVSKSKELGLYSQQYCGCIYSERERFGKGSRSRGKKRNK